MDIAFKVLGSRWGAGKEIIENWRWEVDSRLCLSLC